MCKTKIFRSVLFQFCVSNCSCVFGFILCMAVCSVSLCTELHFCSMRPESLLSGSTLWEMNVACC